MTVFDPANDLIDVFSTALGAPAEVTGNVIVSRALTSLGISLGGSGGDGNCLVGYFAGVAPLTAAGRDGDYAFDTSTGNLYGPKTAGVWPSSPVFTMASATSAIFGTAIGNYIFAPISGGLSSTPTDLGYTIGQTASAATLIANGYGTSSTPGNWWFGTITGTWQLVGWFWDNDAGFTAYSNLVWKRIA